MVFRGSGATAGINRLVALLGAGSGARVILGPCEHHPYLLPWRDSGAAVIELAKLARRRYRALCVARGA